LAQAAAGRLRAAALGEFRRAWEQEAGAVSVDELAGARRWGIAVQKIPVESPSSGSAAPAEWCERDGRAVVVVLAGPGDRVLTGDPGDLRRGAAAAASRR
jgi:hypothetical protein